MYIIRPPPMSTRLAKDSARAVVASEQASTIRASNFTTMCFMAVRLSPSIHLLDVRQLPQITPSLGEAQKLSCKSTVRAVGDEPDKRQPRRRHGSILYPAVTAPSKHYHKRVYRRAADRAPQKKFPTRRRAGFWDKGAINTGAIVAYSVPN